MDEQGDPMAFQGKTDAEGSFVIKDAITGPVLLGLFPYNEPEMEILKLQIGDMFLYAPDESWGRGVVFSVEPRERIEDVEVTVQRFLQLRAKVLKDGRESTRQCPTYQVQGKETQFRWRIRW